MKLLEKIKDVVKLPKLEEMEKIMVVQPHPDDTEIAMGGTIAKLTKAGVEVIYVSVTDGSLGTHDPNMSKEDLAKIRRREQERAAEVLGVKEIIWLRFEDGGDYDYLDVRKEVVKLIRSRKPQFVFTVDPTLRYEFHPDHLKTGRAVSEAVLFYQFPHFENEENVEIEKTVQGIGYFFTPKPNEFICIDDVRELKIKAISMHESQMGDGMKLLLWYLEEKEKEYATGSDCEYVEPLRILPNFALHAFPEVELM